MASLYFVEGGFFVVVTILKDFTFDQMFIVKLGMVIVYNIKPTLILFDL